MTQTADWLDAIDGTNALDAEIRYSLYGLELEIDSSDAARIPFEHADQVRAFVSYPQKRNFEGRFWLSSSDEHVPFESFWERAFLATLDRTGTARSVTAQPMWIAWRIPRRSHDCWGLKWASPGARWRNLRAGTAFRLARLPQWPGGTNARAGCRDHSAMGLSLAPALAGRGSSGDEGWVLSPGPSSQRHRGCLQTAAQPVCRPRRLASL